MASNGPSKCCVWGAGSTLPRESLQPQKDWVFSTFFVSVLLPVHRDCHYCGCISPHPFITTFRPSLYSLLLLSTALAKDVLLHCDFKKQSLFFFLSYIAVSARRQEGPRIARNPSTMQTMQHATCESNVHPRESAASGIVQEDRLPDLTPLRGGLCSEAFLPRVDLCRVRAPSRKSPWRHRILGWGRSGWSKEARAGASDASKRFASPVAGCGLPRRTVWQ